MATLTASGLVLILAATAQIVFTLALILFAGRTRLGAIRRGEVHIRDIAVSGEGWPPAVRAVGNAMNNQFETPTLFYALVAFLVLLGDPGWIAALIAWGYVGARIGHAVVYIRGNHVPTRFRWFFAGFLFLAALAVLTFGIILLRLVS